MIEPAHPYLLFHPKFVWKTEGKRWEYQMDRKTFKKGWWKGSESFVIDVQCRRFDLLDVESDGVAWTVWNLFRSNEMRLISLRYICSDPQQLTFEQARETYVEYICEHRWWSATHENEEQFRARNAEYTKWADVVEFVSLAGRHP
ncbi:hypothetical protein [Qipengyuania sp. DGS5-3]|uniref:hypothetical protein n=1 Tax=Qipengyuania sp. DGS5-3 TaxID=3349632 RepID=UPI0036D36965